MAKKKNKKKEKLVDFKLLNYSRSISVNRRGKEKKERRKGWKKKEKERNRKKTISLYF